MFKLSLLQSLWVLSLFIALTPPVCRAEFKDPTKPDIPIPAIASDKNSLPTEDKPVLSAIWITASGKWATINGVTTKQGQTILQGVKILKITRNTVSLNNNGHLQILRLLKSPYKTQ